MRSKKAKQLCVICGSRPATTRDHIPPKALFGAPRPNNLITVPACFGCNHRGGREDERFVAFIGLHAAQRATRPLNDPAFQAAVKIIQRNNKLYRHVIDNSQTIDIVTPSGIFLEKRRAVMWDSSAHSTVLTRMVRGLYYHHTKSILPQDARIQINWHYRLDDELVEMLRRMRMVRIGGDAFVYFFGIADTAPTSSVWVFRFHASHIASATTDAPLHGETFHALT